MAIYYPKARLELLPAGLHSTAILNSIGLILHVNAGESDPYWTFEGGQANSHWQINDGVDGLDGEVVQYVDAAFDSWAQIAGNDSYHSVETGGEPTTALTPAMVDSLVELYAWGHVTFGWPFVLAEVPGQPGFGWHGMGGDAWGGHFGCPGDLRKAQRLEILTRAEALLNPPAPKPDPLPIPPEDSMRWIIDPATGNQYLQSGFALQHLSPSELPEAAFWSKQTEADKVPNVSVISKWPGFAAK